MIECMSASVMCTVENTQSIGERKNMNLPGVKVDVSLSTLEGMGWDGDWHEMGWGRDWDGDTIG